MPPTDPSPRGLLLGICLIAASTFIVLASFTYMLPAMLADLGLSSEQGSLAMKVPSLAALLMVFVAGRLGDRLGHRRVILALGTVFIAGCVIVALAQGLAMVAIGLFLEGVAATGIQIVVVGLLAARYAEPRARAAAFATFGMTYPAVYLVFPVIAGWLTTFVSWRAIPLAWAIAGALMLIVARTLLPGATPHPVGELWTPVLAGLVAVGIVQTVSHLGDSANVAATVSAAIAVGALVSCTLLYRRQRQPSLSIAPLRNGALRILLAVVLLVPTLNTFFFVTIALQYMYGRSAFAAAILMMPAQVAAMLGARMLSKWLTERWGVHRSGVALLLALAIVMTIPLTFSGSTPLWWVIVYVCAFGAVVTAIGVVVLNALMSSAPASESGNTSAFKGSATEIGIALGVVLMTALVFGAGRSSLEGRLLDSGLPPEEAAAVFAELQEAATSPQIGAAYSQPLPDGSDASTAQKEAMADGLKVNGAAGIVIALAAAGLFALHRRRPAPTESVSA